MNAIREIKDELYCSIENAIIYENNTYRKITGNYKIGYEISNLKTVKKIEFKEEEFICLYTTIEMVNKNLKISAGETSYGGEGFIAVKDINLKKILWILILSTMNNPIGLTIEDENVILKTDLNYPNGVNFIIPLDSPEKFMIEKGEI